MKTTSVVAASSASVGLNIHKEKNNILKYNPENTNPITLDGETLDDMESFTRLVISCIIDEERKIGSRCKEEDRQRKDRFLQLNKQHMQHKTTVYQPISKSHSSMRTSRQSILLYGAETSTTTTTIMKKVHLFINGCPCEVPNSKMSINRLKLDCSFISTLIIRCPRSISSLILTFCFQVFHFLLINTYYLLSISISSIYHNLSFRL
ncbi:unnamed protein product [Schistosoma curassoni]|nr:unnamed protein product [Schistosoma curassoni]